MAQAESEAGPLELPGWKTWLSAGSAVLLALTFIVAGVWKVTDPLAAAVRMTQAQVPPILSLPAALALGISETFAGALLLVPRFRRWGAWLSGLLLVAFMIYIGLYYDVLRGEECNCFPWVKRAVGPAFFIGDAIMLLLALAAGWWARPSQGLRNAMIVFGAVCVFAGVSYGVIAARRNLVSAPDSVMVDGKPFPLHRGRVFLFFFNPECLHCSHAAQDLAKLNWGQTSIIAVTTQTPEFATEFLDSTGLPGMLSTDVEALRKDFSFVAVPFGVALENGRQREAFTSFDPQATAAALRKLGFVK
jgi:uncharacterized membrane protein YphA (DoxX/SURF4 family)